MEYKPIDHLIDETESLTDLQKSFYKSCIQNRYNKILVTALRKTESRTEP